MKDTGGTPGFETADGILPDEILDAILGHLVCSRPFKLYDEIHEAPFLAENKRDLLIASHVSRRWRRCALPHLFRDIDIKIGPDPAMQRVDVQDIVRDYFTLKKDLRQLLSFLEANPHVASCIRTLFITRVRVCEVFRHDTGSVFVVLDTDPNVLASILRRLPALRALGLRNIGLASSMLLGLPVKVQSLLLIGTLNQDTVFPDTALSIFSEIEHLHVAATSLRRRPTEDVVEDSEGPSIRMLTIHQGVYLWPYKNACLQSSTPLRSFTLGYNEDWWILTTEPLRDLLAPFTPSLITFQCYMREGLDRIEHLSKYYETIFADLCWPELEHLTLAAKDTSGEPFHHVERSSFWYHLPEILAFFFSCSSLRTITLLRDRELLHDPALPASTANSPKPVLHSGSYSSSEVELRGNYYAALEHVLSRFKSLESVTFALGLGEGSRLPDKIEEEIVLCAMPTLKTSGILRFADAVSIGD